MGFTNFSIAKTKKSAVMCSGKFVRKLVKIFFASHRHFAERDRPSLTLVTIFFGGHGGVLHHAENMKNRCPIRRGKPN
jgi:hypothetical protein